MWMIAGRGRSWFDFAARTQPVPMRFTMDFAPIERDPAAFQRPVGAAQLLAMCRRAFGADVAVRSVVELGWGEYNNTYRVELEGRPTVVLRVAPEPARQYRCERQFMRNEYATIPYLAPIAEFIPRTLAVDFTQQIIGRDYLFQTLLPGVPAPDGLAEYPRADWATFFRQLGAITRTIHDVRGSAFGPVAGPHYPTWSEALIAHFTAAASDLRDVGLDAADVCGIRELIIRHREILDQITEPRLLHGDLWTVNVLIQPGPTISGVCDADRTWWGDPLADWPIYRAGIRPGTERDAFWDSYGRPPSTPDSAFRDGIYLARHLIDLRLNRYRVGRTETIAETYDQLREVLATLSNGPGVPSGK
jgi:aminoglycoside phosphotransferase (APT) family kinase protein